MKRISPRQRATLLVIHESIVMRGFPPTQAEIARKLGVTSTRPVAEHLDALAAKGFIARDGDTTRGMRVTDRGFEEVGKPSLPVFREAMRRVESAHSMLARCWVVLAQTLPPASPLFADLQVELAHLEKPLVSSELESTEVKS